MFLLEQKGLRTQSLPSEEFLTIEFQSLISHTDVRMLFVKFLNY